MPQAAQEPRWLLLIHQIPPRPHYLRAKIGRRLQKLGAVAVKNAVYALPGGEQAREDLNWVLGEIVAGGGDGWIVEARFVEGVSDEQVRELFRAARDAEYGELCEEARALRHELPRRGDLPVGSRAALESGLARLRKRLLEIAELDFFAGRGREAAEGLLQELARRVAPEQAQEQKAARPRPQGATWVTRSGIHVDRMASAWLIRRFIDEDAQLKFVSTRAYRHGPGELRFDMFDGEFTHRGELCTFEVLLRDFSIRDAALDRLGEIVHDIDLKEDKHGRPEKAGLEQLVNAIALAHPEDEVRLARACAALDDLYELYRRKR